MDQKLTSIFETQGTVSLNISNQSFSNENIDDQFIDCSFFDKVNFLNCCFESCEMLGVELNFCVFKNCIFNDTIIRKSEITDCKFKDCKFINSQLSPKTNFFRTLFINSEFSDVNLTWTFFHECQFTKINLTKIKVKGLSVVDTITENISFNDLEFDKTDPISITITDSFYFPKEI